MFELYNAIGDNFAGIAHLSIFWGTLGFTVALYAKSIISKALTKAQPEAR